MDRHYRSRANIPLCLFTLSALFFLPGGEHVLLEKRADHSDFAEHLASLEHRDLHPFAFLTVAPVFCMGHELRLFGHQLFWTLFCVWNLHLHSPAVYHIHLRTNFTHAYDQAAWRV